MTNFKKVILVAIIMILISAIATVVSATNDNFQIITDSNVDNNTILNIMDTTNNTVQNNTVTDINSILNNVNSVSNNTSVYNNTATLPQTGAGDYTMILIIAVLAVSAVYAYIKIRDYKNI